MSFCDCDNKAVNSPFNDTLWQQAVYWLNDTTVQLKVSSFPCLNVSSSVNNEDGCSDETRNIISGCATDFLWADTRWRPCKINSCVIYFGNLGQCVWMLTEQMPSLHSSLRIISAALQRVGPRCRGRVIRQGMKTHLDVNHHVGIHLHAVTATTCLLPSSWDAAQAEDFTWDFF